MQTPFYRVRRDLSIDIPHAAGLLETLKPQALLFIHYFGFPVCARTAAFLRQAASQCCVIEDCSHGSLIEPPEPVVGNIGAFSLTSFRKYFPVPDGGLVVCRSGASLPTLPAPQGCFTRQRLLGKLLRHEFVHGSPESAALEPAFLALFADAEAEVDAGVPWEAMSALSERLLRTWDWADAMQRRRRNFALLRQAFAADARLQRVGQPLFMELPEGVSPLAFPLCVAAPQRDALRAELAARRVFCPVHWLLPPAVGRAQFPESYQLSQEMLSLPIDQRYGAEHMEALLCRIREAGEGIQ